MQQEEMDLAAPVAPEYVMEKPKPKKLLEFPRSLGTEPCAFCHVPGHLAENCGERMKAERAAHEASAAAPSNHVEKLKVEPPKEPQVLEKLTAPAGISKSMVRALECPTFFTGQYLQRVAEAEHFLARTGNEFHAWREAYTNHLVDAGTWQDAEFKTQYLQEQVLSDDARTLIARDNFQIDPDTVYGCELFLSIDREFRPLEHEIGNRKPGRLSSDDRFLASGTIDLLLLEDNGRSAVVRDPKSGFSTVGVTDTEPPIYAALVMIHFPLVEEVRFIWDFVRHSAIRRTSYTRDDLSWIKDLILNKDQLKDELVRRYNAGETLDANPFSGMCPYCQLTCPLRPRWEDGQLAIAAPQTKPDAIRLAQLVKVCEDVIGRAKELVGDWLDQEPAKKLELGSGWEARLRVSEVNSHPLPDALRVLGLEIVDLNQLPQEARELLAQYRPDHTPNFDVPLDSLTIGGLSGFSKTKKSKKRGDAGGVSREAMKETLLAIAKRGASTTVVIRKAGQEEATPVTEELLAASLEL